MSELCFILLWYVEEGYCVKFHLPDLEAVE